jgi:hypothetical protein
MNHDEPAMNPLTAAATDGTLPVPRHVGPCAHIGRPALERALGEALGADLPYPALRETHPHLFSFSSVFVRPTDLEAMRAIVAAVENVVANPAYREAALARATDTARHDARTAGVFMGYDFHLDPDGPRLIEINTNAGGAVVNLTLLRAHLACCPPLAAQLPGTAAPEAIEAEIVAMFRQEWRAARGDAPLGLIAIVDDAPADQYLYPEFQLFERLLRRHGLDARIADASALTPRDGRLWLDDAPVDLVYNRLTDFALDEPRHAALRRAWLEDLAVVTPHPRAHALYADKRNLALLSDPERLRALGVAEATIAVLERGVAHTRPVQDAQAESLWAERKRLFFKPVSGYGSKAVYRGDKLTRRVWDEILAGDYVAQTLVPPSEQDVAHDGGEPAALKYDLRHFVYAGRTQLLSARLYRGQTTNFRTPGGGFAPVFRMPNGKSA